MSTGDWGAAIAAPGWPGFDVTVLDTISLWFYSAETIPSLSLPKIYLEDLSNQKTAKINISDYYGDLAANVWSNIKIPISIFVANPGSANLTSIKVIYLGQSISDSTQHTIFIDEVKITGVSSPVVYKNIVVIGSSTAAGTGTSNPDSAWVNRFRNYIISHDTTYKVINLAVGGYTTYNVMPTGFVPPNGRPNPSVNNNITKALTFNPVALLINLPSNDAANNYTMLEQISNYDTLVNIIINNDIPFWMSTTQPRNFSNQSQLILLFAMRDSTYSRYGEYVVDFWTTIAQSNGWINPIYNSGDGVHLNDSGHRLLFERIRDAVSPAILGVEDDQLFISDMSFILYNNYPNPFNPSTTISFKINHRAMVRLDVLNVLGQVVKNLISSELESGEHSVNFSGNDLSSAVYICRIIVDTGNNNYSASNKMLLIK